MRQLSTLNLHQKIAIGIGSVCSLYALYRTLKWLKKSNSNRLNKPGKLSSSPADVETLVQGLRVLKFYSSQNTYTEKIERNVIHLVKTYTSEVLQKKQLAQKLLLNGLVDSLFSFFSLSHCSPELKLASMQLLSNLLVSPVTSEKIDSSILTSSADLAPTLIANQPLLTTVVNQNCSRLASKSMQYSTLLFFKNLIAKPDVVKKEELMYLLFTLYTYYRLHFTEDCQLQVISVFINAFDSDEIRKEFLKTHGGIVAYFKEHYNEKGGVKREQIQEKINILKSNIKKDEPAWLTAETPIEIRTSSVRSKSSVRVKTTRISD